MNSSTPPSSRNKSQSQDPAPEIDPSPQTVPKKFPENPAPLDEGDSDEGASQHAGSGTRLGSGEDPMVESGMSENDPEQPDESELE